MDFSPEAFDKLPLSLAMDHLAVMRGKTCSSREIMYMYMNLAPLLYKFFGLPKVPISLMFHVAPIERWERLLLTYLKLIGTTVSYAMRINNKPGGFMLTVPVSKFEMNVMLNMLYVLSDVNEEELRPTLRSLSSDLDDAPTVGQRGGAESILEEVFLPQKERRNQRGGGGKYDEWSDDDLLDLCKARHVFGNNSSSSQRVPAKKVMIQLLEDYDKREGGSSASQSDPHSDSKGPESSALAPKATSAVSSSSPGWFGLGSSPAPTRSKRGLGTDYTKYTDKELNDEIKFRGLQESIAKTTPHNNVRALLIARLEQDDVEKLLKTDYTTLSNKELTDLCIERNLFGNSSAGTVTSTEGMIALLIKDDLIRNPDINVKKMLHTRVDEIMTESGFSMSNPEDVKKAMDAAMTELTNRVWKNSTIAKEARILEQLKEGGSLHPDTLLAKFQEIEDELRELERDVSAVLHDASGENLQTKMEKEWSKNAMSHALGKKTNKSDGRPNEHTLFFLTIIADCCNEAKYKSTLNIAISDIQGRQRDIVLTLLRDLVILAVTIQAVTVSGDKIEEGIAKGIKQTLYDRQETNAQRQQILDGVEAALQQSKEAAAKVQGSTSGWTSAGYITGGLTIAAGIGVTTLSFGLAAPIGGTMIAGGATLVAGTGAAHTGSLAYSAIKGEFVSVVDAMSKSVYTQLQQGILSLKDASHMSTILYSIQGMAKGIAITCQGVAVATVAARIYTLTRAYFKVEADLAKLAALSKKCDKQVGRRIMQNYKQMMLANLEMFRGEIIGIDEPYIIGPKGSQVQMLTDQQVRLLSAQKTLSRFGGVDNLQLALRDSWERELEAIIGEYGVTALLGPAQVNEFLKEVKGIADKAEADTSKILEGIITEERVFRERLGGALSKGEALATAGVSGVATAATAVLSRAEKLAVAAGATLHNAGCSAAQGAWAMGNGLWNSDISSELMKSIIAAPGSLVNKIVENSKTANAEYAKKREEAHREKMAKFELEKAALHQNSSASSSFSAAAATRALSSASASSSILATPPLAASVVATPLTSGVAQNSTITTEQGGPGLTQVGVQAASNPGSLASSVPQNQPKPPARRNTRRKRNNRRNKRRNTRRRRF
jgi:hypothetical protein